MPGRLPLPERFAACFTEAAQRAAQAADIVVVNTHLYGAHLAAGGGVLPPHEAVIFDEAHELEEVMTASLGVRLTPGRFRALGAASRALSRATTRPSPSRSAISPTDCRAHWPPRRHPGRARPDHDPGPTERSPISSSRPATAWTGSSARLRRSERDRDRGAEGRSPRALSAAGNLAEDVSRLLEAEESEVAWVDGDRRSPTLRLSPIDVGPVLAGLVWASSPRS